MTESKEQGSSSRKDISYTWDVLTQGLNQMGFNFKEVKERADGLLAQDDSLRKVQAVVQVISEMAGFVVTGDERRDANMLLFARLFVGFGRVSPRIPEQETSELCNQIGNIVIFNTALDRIFWEDGLVLEKFQLRQLVEQYGEYGFDPSVGDETIEDFL